SSLFSIYRSGHHLHLHSFPTRRSSDLSMKGRMEKMPSVTNPRVANVQKKSFERKAWKKVINAGSLIAVSTVTMPLARNSATTCRSEEHTSELQSRGHLVCRLLLEKKKT